MDKLFDPKKKKKLDSPERRKLMPPKETLLRLDLKGGDFFIDIGCGIGYFSLPASEIVGEKGNVFAVDCSQEMLDDLQQQIEKKQIKNIELIKSDTTSIPLGKGIANYAFLCNVFHEIEDPISYLSQVNELLQPDGILSIIEWKKIAMENGPPVDHRLGFDEIKNFISEAGFQLLETFEIKETFSVFKSRKK